MCIQTCCDHLTKCLNVLHIFDPTCTVSKSGWTSTARMPRLVGSPPSLSPSPPPTPPPSQCPTLFILPPLAKFQLVWRHLCAALLSSSWLARQKQLYLPSRLRLTYVGDTKVVLPWNRVLYCLNFTATCSVVMLACPLEGAGCFLWRSTKQS